MTVREYISQVNAHTGYEGAEAGGVLLHQVLAEFGLSKDAVDRKSILNRLSRAEDLLLGSIQGVNKCLQRGVFYGEGESGIRQACYAVSSVIDLYLATSRELIRREEAALVLRMLDGAALVHLAFDAMLAGDIDDVMSHAKQEFAIRAGS